MKTKPVNLPPSTPAPRAQTEINNDYTTACAQAGEMQYKIKAWTYQLEQLNARISELAQEGNRRADLDKRLAEAKEEPQAAQELQS